MTYLEPTRRGLRLAAGLLVAFTFGACADTTGPVADESGALTPSVQRQAEAVPGELIVCAEGPAGTYSFDAALNPDGNGTFPMGTTFDIAAGACEVVYTTTQAQPVSVVTTTGTGMPAATEFQMVTVESPESGFPEGTFYVSSAEATVNQYHGSVVTFYYAEAPPEMDCVGLTPGYWKNWDNHYTMEQFASLLAETGFSDQTVEEATAILSYHGGRDPVARLAKFMLANELTLALSGTDLPNPDGAWLDGSCVDPEGDMTLADALSMSWTIYNADGEGYRKNEINMYKDILDRIANME